MNPVDGQPYSGPVFGFQEGRGWVTGSLKDGELDGLFERYLDNGELSGKGTFRDWEQCGEWLEDGETVTYNPC